MLQVIFFSLFVFQIFLYSIFQLLFYFICFHVLIYNFYLIIKFLLIKCHFFYLENYKKKLFSVNFFLNISTKSPISVKRKANIPQAQMTKKMQ